jgi:ABC-type nitrate/sulfonate/bicarbonate transport system permease component
MAVKDNGVYQILRDLIKLITKGYSVVLVIVLWELAARIINESLFLPAFSSVIVLFFKMIFNLELLPHIYVSLLRTLAGFFLAVLVGIPLGLIMGWSKLWDKFWSPIISLVYPIPKIGLIPLFILWLGIGNSSKVAVIFAAAVFSIILNTYTGVKGTPRYLIWSALTMGATNREVLLKVVLPHSLPYIFAGLRLAMGISWILLFAAEMIAAQTGLGHLILFAERMLQTDVVFVALLTIALFGFMFDRIILVSGKRLCDWYFEYEEARAA